MPENLYRITYAPKARARKCSALSLQVRTLSILEQPHRLFGEIMVGG